MAARKSQKPAEPEMISEWHEVPMTFAGEEGVCVTKGDLFRAVEENMRHKLGAAPVEGQLDDLWRRLRG